MLSPERRPISECPIYRVSPDGVIWTQRTYGGKLLDDWRPIRIKYRLPDGRAVVSLKCGGKSKRFCVGNLVLAAFVGPRPSGLECCHEDGDLRNNSVGNLRWDTHCSNMQDREKHCRKAVGSRVGTSKLTETDVLEIRRRVASGEQQKAVAVDYDIGSGRVSEIVNRKCWAWLS